MIQFFCTLFLASTLTAACASAEPVSEISECRKQLQTAERQASQIALDRDERMKTLRFSSQQAMNEYIAETDVWSMEAIELVVLMNEMTAAFGSVPHKPELTENPTAEDTKTLIASAKSCAAEFLN